MLRQYLEIKLNFDYSRLTNNACRRNALQKLCFFAFVLAVGNIEFSDGAACEQFHICFVN